MQGLLFPFFYRWKIILKKKQMKKKKTRGKMLGFYGFKTAEHRQDKVSLN